MSAAATHPSPLSASRSRFWLRKLHSLTGVVPVGLFLAFHLFTNAKALQGQQVFDAAVRDIQHTPYLPVVELVTVLLPLCFHALYGVKLALESRPNVGAYPTNRNWMYVAQRLTGIATFAFVVWHLSEYWLPKVQGRLAAEQFYPALCANLSSTTAGLPLVALAYVFGIGAAVFHLANGLWGFCCSWGITPSVRSQRLSAVVFGVLGLALFLLGANTAIYFATGSRIAVMGVPQSASTALAVRTCENANLPGAAPTGPAAER